MLLTPHNTQDRPRHPGQTSAVLGEGTLAETTPPISPEGRSGVNVGKGFAQGPSRSEIAR